MRKSTVIRFNCSLLLALFITAAGFAFPAIVAAATPLPEATPVIEPPQALNLTLSPIFLTVQAQPGKTSTQEVRIFNNGPETEHLQVTFNTFQADETGTKPILMEFAAEDDFKNWISMDPPLFDVKPGEWKVLKMNFSPPEGASLDYYYALIFTRQPQVPPRGGEAVVTGAPALLMLANVDSPLAKRELQLDSFTIPKVIFEFLPVPFDVTIKNTGNTFLAPSGNIFIEGNGKKDIATLSLNAGRGNVLPQSKRPFAVEWSDGFPAYRNEMKDNVIVKDEEGNPVRKLQWDFSQVDKLRIGKYTAKLLLVYDNGQRDILIEEKQSFWVIPWRILLVLTLVLFFVGAGFLSTIVMVIKKIRKPRHIADAPKAL